MQAGTTRFGSPPRYWLCSVRSNRAQFAPRPAPRPGTTPLAILANSFGWIFTEMGRQPWAVFGEMLTRDALSPSVPAWQVITSLVAFAVLYLVIGTIAVRLIFRYAKAGPPPDAPAETSKAETQAQQLTFAY